MALLLVALFLLSSVVVASPAVGSTPLRSPPHAAPATATALLLDGAERSLALGRGPAGGAPLQCAATGALSGQCSAPRGSIRGAVPRPAAGGAGSAGWQDLTASQPTSPGPQEESMMAYFPDLSAVVLIGGTGSNANHTWTFANGTWSDITSQVTGAPPARWAGGMVYDAADGDLVLFGGRDLSGWYNDTWTFNGTAWTNLHLAYAPAPRAYFSMVYDPTDAYVVLFSGGCFCGPFGARVVYNDTWTYHAGAWTNLTASLPVAPPRLDYFPGTWDAFDGYLVVFGGNRYGGCGGVNLTWTYVGGAWTNRTAGSHGPPTLGGNDALAYDPLAGLVVYFGGVGSSCYAYSDTWFYQNGTWFDATAYLGGTTPSASALGPLTWDARDGLLLLYGGQDPLGVIQNSTEALWLNSSFLLRATASPTGGPAPLTVRFVAAAVGGVAPYRYTWDPGDKSANATGAYFNHTYTRSGTYHASVLANDSANGSTVAELPITVTSASWYEFSSKAVQPPWTYASAMTYDPQIDGVLLFGGQEEQPPYALSDQTWEYTGGVWQNISTTLANAPSARYGDSLTYDVNDSYALLFGGYSPGCVTTVGNYTGGNYCNDTWSFTPSAGWVPILPATAPPPRYQAAMTDDPGDGYVVLFGGYCSGCSGSYFSLASDTWTFRGGEWTDQTSQTKYSPSNVVATSATYDAAIGAVLVYVGSQNCPTKTQTWTFSHGNWTQQSPSTQPPGLIYDALTYDPVLQAAVLFGGYGYATSSCPFKIYNETWTYANGTWTDVSSTTVGGPPDDYLTSMAYDDAAGAVIELGDQGEYYGAGTPQPVWSWPGSPLVTTSTATPSGGVAPFNVTLSASTAGGVNPYNISWDFGDGSPNATGGSVIHQFRSIGNYTVTLTSTDSGGRISVTHLSVVGYPELLASPASTGTLGEAPWAVHFYSNSTGGVPPVARAWKFGDGGTSTAGSPLHTYTTAGNFTATLTLTDGDGATQSWSTVVQVLPHLAAAPSESAGIGQIPFVVNFTSNATGGMGPYAFTWSFGDGSANGSVADPSHTYSTPGGYSIQLTVADALGIIVHGTIRVQVTVPLVAAPAASPTIGLGPLAVTFSDSSTGGSLPYNYTWAFGDGSADAYGVAVEHTYAGPGSYTAMETVVDGIGTAVRESMTITVVTPLVTTVAANATLAIAPASIGFALQPLHGEGPFVYAFRFGDGTTSSGSAMANHSYTRAGTFEVRGTVTDALHESASAYVNVSIVAPLLAQVAASSQTLVLGQVLNLSAGSSGGLGPFVYTWTGLPTGCASSGAATISCTPSVAANYSISVTVSDRSHQNSTSTTWVLVTAPPPAPGGSGGGSSLPGADLLLLVVALVTVAAVALVLLLRRRPGAATDGEAPEEPTEPELVYEEEPDLGEPTIEEQS